MKAQLMSPNLCLFFVRLFFEKSFHTVAFAHVPEEIFENAGEIESLQVDENICLIC